MRGENFSKIWDFPKIWDFSKIWDLSNIWEFAKIWRGETKVRGETFPKIWGFYKISKIWEFWKFCGFTSETEVRGETKGRGETKVRGEAFGKFCKFLLGFDRQCLLWEFPVENALQHSSFKSMNWLWGPSGNDRVSAVAAAMSGFLEFSASNFSMRAILGQVLTECPGSSQ